MKTWGKRKRYNIVEAGDRKGNTSGLGIEAKARANIYVQRLPPRTPSLMPLDYAIWIEIAKKVDATAPKGKETKEAFLARLCKAAMGLRKGYVKSVIKRMRKNIKALLDANGYTPRTIDVRAWCGWSTASRLFCPARAPWAALGASEASIVRALCHKRVSRALASSS